MPSDRFESSISKIRDHAIEDRNRQITASQEAYRRLLSEVCWAIQSIRELGELGSGLFPPQQSPISSEREAQLREFVLKINSGYPLYDLDLAALQDANNQDSQADLPPGKDTNIEDQVLTRQSKPMDVDFVESHHTDKSCYTPVLETAATRVEPSSSNAGNIQIHRSLRCASPESRSIVQPQSSLSNQPDPYGTSKAESAKLLPPFANSKLSRPSSSALNPPVSSLSPTRSTIARASSLPSEGNGQPSKSLRFTFLDYASQLPPLPVHIVASRLSAAQTVAGAASKHSRRQAIRSGLWIGPGSSEITKLGIRAQHIGVKSALRKNSATKSKSFSDKPRLHNVLTTADWKAMLDELQMAKALEALEKLKAEKAWAYSQIKKPRIAHVQKAHWDHLLDEMLWLQVDFRLERRWKIATAHRLAKQVADWHSADSTGKLRMQVKTKDTRRVEISTPTEGHTNTSLSTNGPVHQFEPLSTTKSPCPNRLPSEDHPSAPPSNKDSPELFRLTSLLPTPLPVDPTASSTVEKLAPAAPETSQAFPQESRKVLQQIKRSRIPIFEMAPDETVIDATKLTLDGICAKQTEHVVELVKLQKLFADLPLFGDLDSRPDKRPDEASPHLGRITRVAPFLETKPLLVSTLQPSKNCVRNQWRNLGPLSAEDIRESAENKSESGHHHVHLFSGRKSKEAKEAVMPGPPSSPAPNPERRNQLTLDPVDEELLKQITLTYEFNWKIIADVFNASLARSMNKQATARDCYDSWMRLQSSTKPVDHDRSIPPQKPNAELNTSTAPPPATPLPPNVEASSTEPVAKESAEENTSGNPTKRPGEATLLFPNKRATRDDALQEIARRLKEKRASELPKPSSPTQSRQIILTAHETHAQAIRPYLTPLEMSALKAERDRQTQAALEMAKRQQQLQQESLIQQARAAAVVAAAAQIPLANAGNKNLTLINGNSPSRPSSQPTALNFTQGRHSGLPGVAIHRPASQNPTGYVATPPLLGVGNRGAGSPASSHQARQSLLENQSTSTPPSGSQPPILPQLPNIPQGFRPRTPNSQSPATGPTANHRTPNGSVPAANGLHNSTMSHSLTPIQVAQYLQQQQHLHLQRSPEHQVHHQQHQQILIQQQQQQQIPQHFQHQGQHLPTSFPHQAASQVFGHQSPPHPHQSNTISNGQAQISSGAASANNSTPPLTSSSSPLPQPPT